MITEEDREDGRVGQIPSEQGRLVGMDKKGLNGPWSYTKSDKAEERTSLLPREDSEIP